MSLLSLIQDATDLIGGIDRPDAVASSTEDTVRQLKALAQVEGDFLARKTDWRRLKVPGQITGDGSTEYWALPADWDKSLDGDALFMSSEPHRSPVGPMQDQEFVALTAQGIDPMRPVWRYFGEQMQIWPVLRAGEIVTLNYRSANWISSADGTTTRARWEADTDYALVPERVLKLGVVWRWKRAKGLDYAEEFNDYMEARGEATRLSNGVKILRMGGRRRMDDMTNTTQPVIV